MAFGVAGVIVGFLFALAGAIKIIFPAPFRDTLTEMKVTGKLQPAIRIVLPMLEVAIGLAILTGTWTSAACWVALALLVFFVVMMWGAVTRGEGIPCACFGGRKPVDMSLIVRNVVLGSYASAAAIAAPEGHLPWGSDILPVAAWAVALVLIPLGLSHLVFSWQQSGRAAAQRSASL
jgi:hypothetical protein